MGVLSTIKGIGPGKKWAVKVVATVVLLGYLAHTLDTKTLVAAVANISAGAMAIGILVSATFVVSRIFKWRVLTGANGLAAPAGLVFRVMLLSLLLGIVTPARIGETLCVTPFPKEHRARALLLYFYDRLGELCVTLLLGIPGCVLFLGLPGQALALGFATVAVVGVLTMQVRTFRLRFLSLFLLKRFAITRDLLSSNVSVPPAYWLVIALGYLQAYVLVAAFIAGSISVADWRMVLLLPVVTLSNLIPLTIGGLGVREGLAAGLLPLAAVPAQVGAAAFFLSFFFTRLVPGLIGLVWSWGQTLPLATRSKMTEDQLRCARLSGPILSLRRNQKRKFSFDRMKARRDGRHDP